MATTKVSAKWLLWFLLYGASHTYTHKFIQFVLSLDFSSKKNVYCYYQYFLGCHSLSAMSIYSFSVFCTFCTSIIRAPSHSPILTNRRVISGKSHTNFFLGLSDTYFVQQCRMRMVARRLTRHCKQRAHTCEVAGNCRREFDKVLAELGEATIGHNCQGCIHLLQEKGHDKLS